jgi:hypothetical protein
MDAFPESADCPEYHPLSELRDRSGYYPNLTEQHLQAMREFNDLLAKEALDIRTDDEHIFLKKLRFLRARQFKPSAAFDMIKKDTEMRRAADRAGLRFENASDVLQCDLRKVYEYFPSWVQGFDKQDRPIAWRNFGKKFEIWNILKLTSMERLIRFHAWEGEQAIRIMNERSATVGHNIETFVIVVDADGWYPGLATSDAFTYIKAMATTDSDHYPERLGRMLVINAPYALSFAWRVISSFLDPVTRAKIQILSNPSDWQPVLFEFVDKDQVPVMYGGTAPDPTPENAINSINPPIQSQHRLSPAEAAEATLALNQETVDLSTDAASMQSLAEQFATMVSDDSKTE